MKKQNNTVKNILDNMNKGMMQNVSLTKVGIVFHLIEKGNLDMAKMLLDDKVINLSLEDFAVLSIAAANYKEQNPENIKAVDDFINGIIKSTWLFQPENIINKLIDTQNMLNPFGSAAAMPFGPAPTMPFGPAPTMPFGAVQMPQSRAFDSGFVSPESSYEPEMNDDEFDDKTPEAVEQRDNTFKADDGSKKRLDLSEKIADIVFNIRAFKLDDAKKITKEYINMGGDITVLIDYIQKDVSDCKSKELVNVADRCCAYAISLDNANSDSKDMTAEETSIFVDELIYTVKTMLDSNFVYTPAELIHVSNISNNIKNEVKGELVRNYIGDGFKLDNALSLICILNFKNPSLLITNSGTLSVWQDMLLNICRCIENDNVEKAKNYIEEIKNDEGLSFIILSLADRYKDSLVLSFKVDDIISELYKDPKVEIDFFGKEYYGVPANALKMATIPLLKEYRLYKAYMWEVLSLKGVDNTDYTTEAVNTFIDGHIKKINDTFEKYGKTPVIITSTAHPDADKAKAAGMMFLEEEKDSTPEPKK